MSNTITKDNPNQLNQRQLLFCQYYVELGNETQAAIKAGYSPKTAHAQASRLLKAVKIKEEITKLMQPTIKEHEKHIATGQEVMQFFTRVMNGEIKDQFGLEASLSDRTRAAQELAKRTVDIDNRTNGVADAKVEISIDWSR